jgi:lycopene beta-cyclase
MRAPDFDLLILGSGPSALALAAATAEQGLHTRLLAPQPEAAWTHTYGAWGDELEGLFSDRDEERLVEASWVRPLVASAAVPERALARRYLRLSTAALQATLRERCARVGVDVEPGLASAVEHGEGGSEVRCADGRVFGARLVVDATGRGAFLQPGRSGKGGVQTAYGLLVEVEGHPWSPGEMVFMDWRGPESLGSGPLLVDPAEAATPTFLYAMPLGRDRVFVEETSLVDPVGLPMEELSRRLHRRLRRMGLVIRAVEAEERCVIPMGGPLPALNQRTLGFGAAAGMVHPATGYLVARALSEASRLGPALATALSAGRPAEAARAGWETLWTPDRLRQWELYRFGMGVLCSLDRQGVQSFFDTFFSLPDEQWQGFLSARHATPALLGTMYRFFKDASAPVRRELLSAGVSPRGVETLLRVVGV